MSVEEARDIFLLRPEDKVTKKGILELQRILTRRLRGVSYYSKKQIEIELEALDVLLVDLETA